GRVDRALDVETRTARSGRSRPGEPGRLPPDTVDPTSWRSYRRPRLLHRRAFRPESGSAPTRPRRPIACARRRPAAPETETQVGLPRAAEPTGGLQGDVSPRPAYPMRRPNFAQSPHPPIRLRSARVLPCKPPRRWTHGRNLQRSTLPGPAATAAERD